MNRPTSRVQTEEIKGSLATILHGFPLVSYAKWTKEQDLYVEQRNIRNLREKY